MLHDGLKKRSAPPVDASMKLGSGSVNSGTTRSSVGQMPKKLGPRSA